MTRQVLYDLEIGRNARVRHVHQMDHGRVTGFTVQLEVWHNAGWRVVIRYDCHHGFPHKDIYRKNGQSRKMQLDMSFEDALTVADTDIRERWEIYIERFLRGERP